MTLKNLAIMVTTVLVAVTLDSCKSLIGKGKMTPVAVKTAPGLDDDKIVQ